MIMEEQIDIAGAGFLIFRKDTMGSSSPLMLALVRDDGLLDIPKGRKDPGESSLETAKRECFEECSIVVSDDEMLFNKDSHSNGLLDVFCATTNGTPLVTVNPHSGIQEHVSAEWVTQHDFCSRCLNYLTPAVNHFYFSHSQTYNNT